jgi:hypothetical protein
MRTAISTVFEVATALGRGIFSDLDFLDGSQADRDREIGSAEGTAEKSPVSGRLTVEADYIRLLNPFKWCPHQTEGIEILQRYQAKVFESG